MDVFNNILIIVVAATILLGVIIAVHEMGHFLAARYFGVNVLKFKIGFGKTLLSTHDKHGTEFSIGLIPMGGYVQMQGEVGYEVKKEETYLNKKSYSEATAGERSIIAAAGPFANFVLAIFLYTCIFLYGIKDLAPVIGTILPESIAEQVGLSTGDRIISIDDKEIYTFSDINTAIFLKIGDKEESKIKFLKEDSNQEITSYVSLENFSVPKEGSLVKAFGVGPLIPAIVSSVMPNGSAFKAGLEEKDHIMSLDGVGISSWDQLVLVVDNAMGREVMIRVKRDNQILSFPILVEKILIPTQDNSSNSLYKGRLGITRVSSLDQFPDSLVITRESGLIQSLYQASVKTFQLSALILDSLKKMLFGTIGTENIGGPIQISVMAGTAAKLGLIAFLNMMAFLSVNLGLLNLLPIPILDGGQLTLIAIEKIKGSPISEKFLEYAFKFSLLFVISLMVFALFNDVMRII